jgi:hypothetical protein
MVVSLFFINLMKKEDMMQATFTAPPTATVHSLRDVRDLEDYVSESLAAMGVAPTSPAHRALVQHGVRSAYRVERALPPEVSLREVLDQVLPARLSAPLRRVGTPALAGPAAARS